MAEINLPMMAMGPADSLQFPQYIPGDVDHYALDDTTDEGGLWRIGKLPTLTTGSMTVDFDVFATATTGTVALAVQALAYTVGTDTTDITAAAFATAVVSTATTVSGTTLVPVRISVTLTTGSQQDSAVTGDYFILKFYRDTSADSLSGDAFVSMAHLSYAAS